MYFYELSESDDEIFANLLLAHDSEYDEQEFLELVLEAREAVLEKFEEDSLIEAIATSWSGGTASSTSTPACAPRCASPPRKARPRYRRRRAWPPRDRASEDDFRTMLVEVEPEDRRLAQLRPRRAQTLNRTSTTSPSLTR